MVWEIVENLEMIFYGFPLTSLINLLMEQQYDKIILEIIVILSCIDLKVF